MACLGSCFHLLCLCDAHTKLLDFVHIIRNAFYGGSDWHGKDQRKPKSITWVAMIFASFGIYLMVLGYQLKQNFGNLLALLSAIFFALMLVSA